jgi:hypothetical protein
MAEGKVTRLKQDLAAAGEERRELLVSCLWDAELAETFCLDEEEDFIWNL